MINIYRRVCVCMWQRNTCTSHMTDKSLVKCRIRLDDMELEHVYQCLLFTHTHTHMHARGCAAIFVRPFTLACVYFSSRLSTVTQSFTSTSTYLHLTEGCSWSRTHEEKQTHTLK